MITFEVNPQCQYSRCDSYYLASILLAEMVVKDLKPMTNIHYIYDFFEGDVYAPKIKVKDKSNNRYAFSETIESEVNKGLNTIWNNTISDLEKSSDIAIRIKEFLKAYSRTEAIFSDRKLNIHQLLDELTPFAIEENIISHQNLTSEYKLMVLLMAIYNKKIPQMMVQDVLDHLEQELYVQ